MMDIKIKHRLAGIIVLVVLMLIVVPSLFTGSKNSAATDNISASIPTPPPTPTIKPVTIQNTATHTKSMFTVAGKPIAMEAGPVTTAQNITKKAAVRKTHAIQKKRMVLHKKWAVQLASFDSEKHAMSLVRKLRKKKRHAYLHSSKIGSKNVYRVYVGPVTTRAKADSLQKMMRKEFKLSGLVVDNASY